MTEVIKTVDLVKRFGSTTAVNGLSITVHRGETFGLLGPNGSGKTTTLGMLLTLLKPTAGAFELFGSADASAGLKRTGVLLESASYYPELSAYNNLLISARIKGVDKSRIDDVLQTVGLDADRNKKVRAFSLGMKQRLSIAAVLLNDPELMIFDEPTNGLDPIGIAEVRQLLLRLGREGKTILIASHSLSEMEKVCTNIAIMKRGNLIETGALQALISGHASLEDYFLAKAK
ncbi:MAG TPA: ATP-binding cassette domain-containing protein [Chitinophagales bacterium]|nr:ATP-binding cassette domain-containing protein [Chitinophagales bacterium]